LVDTAIYIVMTEMSITRAEPPGELDQAKNAPGKLSTRYPEAMIPVGYMAKKVLRRPEWLKTDQVVDVYSVSNCVSDDFCDYINYWKHNGYWFFDSPKVIREIARCHDIDLTGTTMFYYEAYEFQCMEDCAEWEQYFPEESFKTDVVVPEIKVLHGYDVVSFSCGTSPECSYLSCNHMAQEIPVNRHCLLRTFEEAKNLLDRCAFKDCEPGPCRIFAVYTIPPVPE
jgi:hypothetical protein